MTTYGSEISLTWKPYESWLVEGSYSYLFNEYNTRECDLTTSDHSHISRFHLHSHVDATKNLGLDAHIFWNNSSELFYTKIPENLRLDLGLTYKITDHIDISLVGQNLLDPDHSELEWEYDSQPPIEIPRNIAIHMKVSF